VDEIGAFLFTRGEGSVANSGSASALGRIRDEHISGVQNEPDLDYPEEHEYQQRANQGVLHHRRAALGRLTRREARYHFPEFELVPDTLSTALENAPPIFDPTRGMSTTTTAALMMAIITQPGMSPRSRS
jgi:hypothetical protein